MIKEIISPDVFKSQTDQNINTLATCSLQIKLLVFIISQFIWFNDADNNENKSVWVTEETTVVFYFELLTRHYSPFLALVMYVEREGNALNRVLHTLLIKKVYN